MEHTLFYSAKPPRNSNSSFRMLANKALSLSLSLRSSYL